MMNVDRLILGGICLLTVCRWLLGVSMELTGEEALFWMESQRLDGFFIDHGPLVPGLIRLSTSVFGDTLLGIRYWNPLLILLATWFLYLLARSVFQQVVARWSVVVFQLSPFVNVAGVSAIDLSLTLCLFLAGSWGLWCGLHRVHRWHGAWWGGGMAFGGMASLSMPVGVASLLGIVAALLFLSRWESQWRRPGIWILLGVGIMVPGILMAVSGHGLLSVKYLFRPIGLHPLEALRALFVSLWWVGPVFALGFAWAGRRWRSWRRDHGMMLLAIIGVVTLMLGMAWSGITGSSSVLWLVGAVPCLVVLNSNWLAADMPLREKTRWRVAALASAGALSVVGVNTANLKTLGFPWPAVVDTPRLEEGWAETADAVEATLESGLTTQPDGNFLVAEDPKTAALIEFYLSGEAAIYRPDVHYPKVHVVESTGWDSVYDLWPQYSHAQPSVTEVSPFRDATAMYIRRGRGEAIDTLPSNLTNAFRAFSIAAVVEVKRRRRELHAWTLYYALDYRGLPL